MTSVSSLLSASESDGGFAGGSVPSAYAVALASRLARQKHPTILVGWSMGGIVALETAIHFPELVRRLVLISSCACSVRLPRITTRCNRSRCAP